MFIDGYQVVLSAKDDLEESILDCLVDSMTEPCLTLGCFEIPTHLNLRYSEQGGLGLTIGRFHIVIPSFDSPPGKDEVVALIRQVYEGTFDCVDMPLRIGSIKENVIAEGEEYGLEIEIIRPQ